MKEPQNKAPAVVHSKQTQESEKSEIGHSLTNRASREINPAEVVIIQQSILALSRRTSPRCGARFPMRWSACQPSHSSPRWREGAGTGRDGMGWEGRMSVGVLGHGAPRGKTIGLGRTCAATVKLSRFYLSEGLPRWSEERNYFQLIKATYAKTIKVLIGHLFIKTGAVKRGELLHADVI